MGSSIRRTFQRKFSHLKICLVFEILTDSISELLVKGTFIITVNVIIRKIFSFQFCYQLALGSTPEREHTRRQFERLEKRQLSHNDNVEEKTQRMAPLQPESKRAINHQCIEGYIFFTCVFWNKVFLDLVVFTRDEGRQNHLKIVCTKCISFNQT